MKTLIAAALLALAGAARAETFPRPPVEIAVTGFKAELNDGRVVAAWKRYKRQDFRQYRLLKSSKEQPVCPDDEPVFTSSTISDTRFEDGKLQAGTWRYRLCITTVFGDRWLSPVVTVTIAPEQLTRAAPTAADFE
jgi:hypothetical protein